MKDKKIFKIVLTWIVLLIPTYMAVYYISLILSDKLTVENVTKVVATGANNSNYEYLDRSDIKMYVQMIENATSVDRDNSLELETPFALTFYKGKKEIVYDLYLSQNTDDCIVQSSEKQLYFLKSSDAKKLLSTPLADSLYEHNNIPPVHVLYDDGTDDVEAYPSDGVWYLRRPDDSFDESNVRSVFKESNEIVATRGKFMEFKFDILPDMLNVEVYADKQLIYNKPYTDFISEFAYDSHTTLQYVVKASWLKSDYSNFYGEGTYTFDVDYNVPPTFEMSKFDAEPGEIVTVTALNMKESDSPKIKTDMGYETEFLNIGGKLVALLPVGLEFMGKGFTIEVSGSSSVEDTSYQLYVSQPTFKNVKYSAQDASYKANKSKSALDSKAASYNQIFAMSSPDTIYWAEDSEFIMPHGGELKLEYGWTVTTNGVGEINKSINIDIDKGDPIVASNAGRVVFAGTVPDDGNLVVIDHGAGVRTWYGHLNETYIVTGDIVSKNQEIGTAGTSGFYSTLYENLHFAVSVHNVFVNPLTVIEKGILPY